MFPEIHLGSGLVLPTYLVVLSVVYSLLIIGLPKYAQSRSKSPVTALNIAMILMICGIVGGRLFHVFFENLSFYSSHWERVFEFWLGGFVYYGGFFLALAASVTYAYFMKEPILSWMDFYAPILNLGYGFGRISCLMAGCCYGKVCELPWALNGRHPTQAYASLFELLFFPFLVYWLKKQNPKPQGFIFGAWALWHSVGRIGMEILRDDDRGPMVLGLSISTWLSFILFGLGAWLILGAGRSKLLQSDKQTLH